MILSFRTWWRALLVLGALALLPLAWRGLERQPPILIQQLPAESAVPPPAVRLAERTPSPPGPASASVVEAAGAPVGGRQDGEPTASEDAQSTDSGPEPSAHADPRTPEADCPRPEDSQQQAGPQDLRAVPAPPGGASSQVRPGGPSSPRVNVNTADAATLETLPGIGPALAARIIAHRERWGPFTAPEQLTEVSGIGEKRLEQLLPWITVE
ncbi:ComEA family DNA-binding protein [Limnochorda pilosa]|uniref:Helix-hairpin-helix DNA-binding motif class 1 domain-containing protein n=1 Tax=Limnochorda pilosa TaxID=1555112 RepID=A0A0K2SNW5_LIMPI|nr:helix-hairpin-helix domain-containing protein [Limnochorda pilosa]BAS28524.1 hypothetical protein LIP_2694 [Limnochorda pilosa]